MEALDPLFDKLELLRDGLLARLPHLGLALVVLGVTWVVAKLADRGADKILSRSTTRPAVRELIGSVTKVGVWVLGVVAAITIVFPTVTPGKIVAGMGLGSVALGFAFKDVFENFFAGFMILIRDVIELGDVISCEGYTGRVQRISMRDTHLLTLSGELVIVPNAILFKNPIEVLDDQPRRRVRAVCGVDYDADLRAARAALQQALEGCETVDQDERVDVFTAELGGSSVDFELTWWTDSNPRELRRSKGEVLTAVKASLDEAGISIPFPHRTLTFREPLELNGREHAPEEAEDYAHSA